MLQTAQQQQQQWPARPKRPPARPTASSAANPLNLSTGSLFQGACFLLVISGERLGIVGINNGLTSPPRFFTAGKGRRGGREGEEGEKVEALVLLCAGTQWRAKMFAPITGYHWLHKRCAEKRDSLLPLWSRTRNLSAKRFGGTGSNHLAVASSDNRPLAAPGRLSSRPRIPSEERKEERRKESLITARFDFHSLLVCRPIMRRSRKSI